MNLYLPLVNDSNTIDSDGSSIDVICGSKFNRGAMYHQALAPALERRDEFTMIHSARRTKVQSPWIFCRYSSERLGTSAKISGEACSRVVVARCVGR